MRLGVSVSRFSPLVGPEADKIKFGEVLSGLIFAVFKLAWLGAIKDFRVREKSMTTSAFQFAVFLLTQMVGRFLTLNLKAIFNAKFTSPRRGHQGGRRNNIGEIRKFPLWGEFPHFCYIIFCI